MRAVAEVKCIGDVPAVWDTLFAAAPAQSTRAWWAATEQAALPPGTGARYLLCHDNGQPAALFPLAMGSAGTRILTTPYTVQYQPLLTSGADMAAIGRVLAAHSPVLLLEAIDPDWPLLTPLMAGARQAGLRARTYRHFGNWHRNVTGLDWPAYLATRPGRLRETIRRRTAAAARDPAVRLTLATEGPAVLSALAAYEAIYARSWKTPEPFPDFNRALLPGLAADGCLRIGVMWVGDRPIAAQYWTVRHGIATVLKLAHDEADRARSPGTVLTAWMIRQLLEKDRVAELDFGRGDDAYKAEWVEQRRERVGVLLARPNSARGAVALLRHDAGVLRRAVRQIAGQSAAP